jgi:alpha-tubulin suppressor-like RCC1 family protein
MTRWSHLVLAGLFLTGCAAADPPSPVSVSVSSAPPPAKDAPPLADAKGPPRVESVASTDTHACALVSDGRVMCWGQNSGGQLGNGTQGSWDEAPPGFVSGIDDAVEVAVGAYHGCVRHRAGTVSCWGYLIAGDSLTNEGKEESPVPVAIAGLSGVTGITLGIGHKCVLRRDRSVWCWGENYAGALGDGTVGLRRVAPVRVVGLGDDVTQLAAGDRYTCARHADATVSCWGENYFATLGDGTTIDRTRPQKVPGLGHVARVVPINEGWVCALHDDATVSCWGRQLRYKTARGSARPMKLEGLRDVSLIEGGGSAACVRRGREVSCWGRMDEDRLGEDPKVVGSDARDVAIRGWHHVLLVRDDGALVTAADASPQVLIDPATIL